MMLIRAEVVRTPRKPSLAALLIALLIAAQSAFAYEYPMQSEEIREAYALGERNNQETIDYLQKCIRHFTASQKGAVHHFEHRN